MQFVGDKSQFYNPGLEEVEESTVFCECGHSKKIPVEFNCAWKEFQACDKRDLICDKCGDEMTF